jgi:hypothetical protein
MMDPLPHIDKVFSLLVQQEHQLLISMDEPLVLANVSDASVISKGRGKIFEF